MVQLLFNFEIDLAQWPHLNVTWPVGWSFVPWLRALLCCPQWLRRQLQRTGRPEVHVTSHQPSIGQTKQVECLPLCLPALCCISGFFFPPQTAQNFLFDLISSVEKCCLEGPAEILSGPALPKKANNRFAHQEWKKCFCASEIIEYNLSKMN